MQRCLQLAQLGRAQVSPNPMVGSVIVYNNRIIGEGWHRKYGEPHAEVHAINSVKDKSLLAKSTLYVSLEPCAHQGKTPPCSNLITQNNIPKVVVGCRDPFDAVNGKGINHLKNNGVQVLEGVLEEECKELNQSFFIYHQKKRPYVVLKWAQSKDGFIDMDRKPEHKGVHWISEPTTQTLVHQWRSELDGILIGINTLLNDDPSLNTRLVKGRNPVKMLIDPNQKCQPNMAIFNGLEEVHIFSSKINSSLTKGKQHLINFEKNPLEQILKIAYQLSLQSILVEGGAFTLNEFIKNNCWDEARIIEGVSTLNKGLMAPKPSGQIIDQYNMGDDLITIWKP